MERIIKFRGQRIDNREWVYGYLFKDAVNNEDKNGFDYPCIIRQPYGDHFQDFEVAPDTIGQFTGLLDKNGKEIYEGDVLSKDMNCEGRYEVYFRGLSLSFTTKFKKLDVDEDNNLFWKEVYSDHSISGALTYDNVVIGNIYENPELL